MSARRDVSMGVHGLVIDQGAEEPLLVCHGSAPAVLGGGWSALYADLGYAPLIFLELQHESGQRASWILDPEANRLGGRVAELPPAQRDLIAERARPAIAAALADVLLALDPAQADLGFFALSPSIRTELAQLCGPTALPEPRSVAADACGDVKAVTGSGEILLVNAMVQACLATDLQARYLAACQTGLMTWPSPVDGADIDDVRGMVLFPLLQAWRCVDRRHGLVFYILAGGFKQETTALWAPGAGVLITSPAGSPSQFNVEPAPLMQWLSEHVLTHGAGLIDFFARPVRRFAHFTWPRASAHIGHYLWNELSGLEVIVRQLHAVDYPLIYDAGGAGGSAFYGPLQLVFPELQGLFIQDRDSLPGMLDAAYAAGVQVLRFSGSYVSAELRTRIANVVSGTPAAEAARMAVRHATGPVIVFGLRVENRTLVDLAGFYVDLARRLVDRFGAVTIIVDGHNSRSAADRAATYDSFLEHRAAKRPIDVEYEVVSALRAGLDGRAVKLVDCVGMTMLDNLAWLICANYCIAPWGAGLAKYRWVCNLPSYVLLSTFNRVNKNDIHIYSSDVFMERPTEEILVDRALVTDRPDAPVLVQMDPVHVPYYTNYDVAADGAAVAIGEAVGALATGAGRWRKARPHGDFKIINDVLIGAGDQLFLANGGHDILSHVLGQRVPLQSSIDSFRGNIAGRAASAAALGMRYAHVIFPDKQSVMHDAFGLAEPVCLGAVYARHCAAIWSDVVYPCAELTADLEGSYLRTDTHLTHKGTLIVVDAVLRRLFGPACDDLIAALRAAPRGTRTYTGDLGGKLEPPHTEEQVFIHHDPAIKALSNNLNSGNNGAITTYMTPHAPRGERVVVLGDSFGADLSYVLSHVFSTVVFFRTPHWHPELIETVRPDIAITGNVERYLSHVVADAERPNFMLMNAMAYGATPEAKAFAQTLSAQSSFGRAPYRRLMDATLFGAR